MPGTIKQNTDGGVGIIGAGVGNTSGAGEFINVSMGYEATSVDRVAFVATRDYRVAAITGRVEVAGTDGGAVTAVVKKTPSGTAIASGTALHSGTFNLKGTAATNQALTLSTTPADLVIAAGDAIGVDFTGTLTTATGVISVCLCPA